MRKLVPPIPLAHHLLRSVQFSYVKVLGSDGEQKSSAVLACAQLV